jgi:hypothetical protein
MAMAPNRIVILRHGEKPGNPAAPDDPADPNLSPAGVARANMLATLIPSRFGNLNFLVAAENSNKSHRPVETLQPLANKLEFQADEFIQTYQNDSYPVLASDLLVRQKYSGALIIVCWHHGNIPQLALKLGATATQLATPPEMSSGKWNPLVFDRFWVLEFEGGTVVFRSVPQVQL